MRSFYVRYGRGVREGGRMTERQRGEREMKGREKMGDEKLGRI